jgi:Cu/Ag efflux pump CusA
MGRGLSSTLRQIPVLCFYALRRAKAGRVSPLLWAARRAYHPTLDKAMRRPGVTMTVALGALIAAGVLARKWIAI